jgi:Clp amino terminal domain, pathogenicity island component
VYAAVGTGPAPQLPNADRATLSELAFDESTKAAFREALKWALRMGHNYIGTEHLLLGVLFSGGPVAEGFTALGLTPQRAEELITAELTDYVARLQGQLSSVGRNRPAPDPGELRLRGGLFASPCVGSRLRHQPLYGRDPTMYIGIGTVVVIVIIVLIVLALRR